MSGKSEKPAKERIEPTLGGWDDVEFRSPARVVAPRWRDRSVWRRVLIGLAIFIAVLTLFRKPLAEALWPNTRVQELLHSADAALAAGKLTAADGSGARELFEAAQALDNDRSEARTGLTRVANAALGRARAAIRDGQVAEASRMLQLARELQAPRAETDSIASQLRQSQVAHAGIDDLLQQAQAAQRSGRLDGDERAALPLYSRILELQPDHTAALEGREDALTDLLLQAKKALAAGDLSRGAALVSTVRTYDPGHIELPDAQARLSSALERVRNRADADLRRGRVERALAGYRGVIEAAAGDAQQAELAQQGLARVAAALATRSRELAADYRFAEAETLLAQARAAAPQSAEVATAAHYLAQVRASRTRLAATARGATTPKQRRQQALALLQRMEQAQTRGQWLTPPGESAYDRLRAAQGLAPNDPAVVKAETALRNAARACFDDQLQANRPSRAQACHDAWVALEPGATRLGDARRRLALKWLAVGDERLGAGDIAYATQALAKARELDPTAAGLAQFAQRVRDAQAGASSR